MRPNDNIHRCVPRFLVQHLDSNARPELTVERPLDNLCRENIVDVSH